MSARSATATRTPRPIAAARVARESGISLTAAVDVEVRELVASATPTPGEVISLWPAAQRKRLALWICRDEGQPRIRACVRDEHFDPPELVRDFRRMRGDIPVVCELGGGRTVVVGWSALEAAL